MMRLDLRWPGWRWWFGRALQVWDRRARRAALVGLWAWRVSRSPSGKDTHECPKPGCEHQVAFHRFACRNHWYEIPQLLRGRLWREWDNHPGEDSYFTVRAECLAALGVPVDAIADLNGGVPLGGTSGKERGE